MELLIRLSVVVTCVGCVACARFDPDETIQLVPAAEWSVADVEALRQAAACWNLRFGTRFEVVREPTAAQTVDVAYNPFTCLASEGRFSFDQQAQIDVCPIEYSDWPDYVPRDRRLLTILTHELGHAAGIRRHSADWYSVMGGGYSWEYVSIGREQLFGDDDAQMLHDATDFVGTPGCEGKTVIVADDETGAACGCEYDSSVGQVSGGVAVFDVERGQTLVYDHFNETWTWDGAAWIHHTPTVTLPLRGKPAMAYDSIRKRAVLFGGATWDGNLADTWEWDGATWVETSPAISPPPRWGHMMAYDDDRQRIVLFGGYVATDQWIDDTWEYDGATWVQRSPVTSPPGRGNAAFGFDPVRRTLMLFGGYNGELLADQWEWDGTTWSALTPSAAPLPRTRVQFASDGERLLMFGGRTVIGDEVARYDELWQWDGATWSSTSPAFRPSPRDEIGFAFDGARDRLVLIGGLTPFPNEEVWEWDGSVWLSAGYRQCGNGTIESIETCDDGNLAQGDGCSDTCQLE